MRPHEQRVVDEKAELDERISKLGQFITVDGRFAVLPEEERVRMRRQLAIMLDYSSILADRIKAFPPHKETP